MKFLRNFWKTCVGLLLCISIISGSVLAADDSFNGHHEMDPEESATETEAVPKDECEEAQGKVTVPEEETVPSEEAVWGHEEEHGEEEVYEHGEHMPVTEEQTVTESEHEDTAMHTSQSGKKEKALAEEKAPEKQEMREESEPAPKKGTIVKSGDCGFNEGSLFYEVISLGNEEYKLRIYGTGKMLTIGATYGAPWHKYSEGITSIELQNGVESIAQYAFTDCDQVTSLTIPASVSALYTKSCQMKGLKTVYFLGSYGEKFKSDAFVTTSGGFIRDENIIAYYNQNDSSWQDKSFTDVTLVGNELSLQEVPETAATCLEDGNQAYYYNAAWDKYFSDAEGKEEIADPDTLVIPALGHDWDAGFVTKEPTIEKEGVLTYSCKRCEETLTEKIPALTDVDAGVVIQRGECGKIPGEMFYELTSVGDGKHRETSYKLTISGSGWMQDFATSFSAPWHAYSASIIGIEIQDGINGITKNAFTDCDQVTSVTIPASVHSIASGAFRLKGLKNVYFLGSYAEEISSDAFESEEDLTINYNSQDDSWASASFTDAELKGAALSLQKFDAVPPTCTKDGNITYYYSCEWQKYFLDEEAKKEVSNLGELVIPALDHDWDAGVVTEEATESKTGVMTFTCSRCKATREEVLPILAKDADAPESNPTGDTAPGSDDGASGNPGSFQGDLTLTYTETLKGSDGTDAKTAKISSSEAGKGSAGSVKTADESKAAFCLLVLIISAGYLMWFIRKRIFRL